MEIEVKADGQEPQGRILSRVLARELTKEEIARVGGAGEDCTNGYQWSTGRPYDDKDLRQDF